jgi:hypothetical protein
MDKIKKFIRKRKWAAAGLGAALALMLLVAVLCSAVLPDRDKADDPFYEVKCFYGETYAYYSLIVDDKKSARAFKNEIEGTEISGSVPVKCETISYVRAENETLFVYSVMTVLKNVTFAFKEHYVGEDFYQVQYFSADDSVAALTCQYKNDRFDCYDALPPDAECPSKVEDAQQRLAKICDHREISIK